MSLRLTTAATLLHSHVAYTTEETERPVTRVPYRVRRRRAAMYRLGITLACAALIALPSLIAASYG